MFGKRLLRLVEGLKELVKQYLARMGRSSILGQHVVHLVVVNDLYVESFACAPAKNDPPLIVYSYAVHALQLAA